MRTVAGFLCMMIAALLALMLIGGAVGDTLSASQTIVMLAAAVGAGLLGWRLMGAPREPA